MRRPPSAPLVGNPHRHQHRRRLGVATGAGAAGAARNALDIQRHEQRRPIYVFEHEAGVMRQSFGSMTSELRIRHLAEHAVDECVAQFREPRGLRLSFAADVFDGRGRAHGTSHIHRAGPAPALVPTAGDCRNVRGALANVEHCPRPWGHIVCEPTAPSDPHSACSHRWTYRAGTCTASV